MTMEASVGVMQTCVPPYITYGTFHFYPASAKIVPLVQPNLNPK